MAEGRAPGRSTHGGITPSSLGRGSRLGRYELLAPIGVGGMAKVWAARQSGFGGFAKVVAIKTILPHLSRDPDFERLFVDEARVASLVRHSNVCEIFELSEEGQVLFLVMEWVDGDSLVKVLKSSGEVVGFDFRIAARIGAETCAGLHAAHTQIDSGGTPCCIVHRDVSPHNILLSAEGVVKVTDFGVAKAAGQTHDQTVAGQLKGKLEYMSPEQITGAKVDGRTDVFGMGAVIYEATTGRQPFASSGDLEVMNKIVEGRLEPPSTHFARYPRELEAIVMKSMATEPSNRFDSADAMRIALEDWIARSGPPVTHADVAALLRSRVGPKMDERLDRIRAAMSAAPEKNPSHTPSGAGISTSGIIATNRPARVAPAPPAVPKPTLPAAGARPLRPIAPEAKMLDLTEDKAPDSGFNMDTVADFQLPDYLLPGPSPALPPAPPAVNAPEARSAQNARTISPGPLLSQQVEEQALDTRQYVVAAVMGVVVAVVLGGAAYAAWRFMTPPARPPTGQTTGQTHAAASPPAVPPELTTFRVVPANATLYLDGQPLPASARTVPRFEHGRSATLVVRADGFEDETMKLDESVRGTIDVILTTRPSKPAVAANAH